MRVFVRQVGPVAVLLVAGCSSGTSTEGQATTSSSGLTSSLPRRDGGASSHAFTAGSSVGAASASSLASSTASGPASSTASGPASSTASSSRTTSQASTSSSRSSIGASSSRHESSSSPSASSSSSLPSSSGDASSSTRSSSAASTQPDAGVDAGPCGAEGEACCASVGCGAGLLCKSGSCQSDGGQDLVVYVLQDTWVWDGADWTELLIPGPSPRISASMAPVGDRLVLFGGATPDGSTSLSDTWTFDGLSWTQLSVTGPPARASAAMGPLGHDVVLFGGGDGPGVNFGDTWTFDGTSWTEVTSSGPSSRLGTGFASLPDAFVVFGGDHCYGGNDYSCDQSLGDTWLFDGHAWTQGSGGPAGRFLSAMAPLGSSVYLFGGQTDDSQADGGCGDFGDTWGFDGTSWTHVDVSGPGVLVGPMMAALGTNIVMWGGSGCSDDGSSDTWAFDGTRWSLRASSGPPAGFPAFATLLR